MVGCGEVARGGERWRGGEGLYLTNRWSNGLPCTATSQRQTPRQRGRGRRRPSLATRATAADRGIWRHCTPLRIRGQRTLSGHIHADGNELVRSSPTSPSLKEYATGIPESRQTLVPQRPQTPRWRLTRRICFHACYAVDGFTRWRFASSQRRHQTTNEDARGHQFRPTHCLLVATVYVLACNQQRRVCASQK